MSTSDQFPADRPEVDLTLFVACYNEEKISGARWKRCGKRWLNSDSPGKSL